MKKELDDDIDQLNEDYDEFVYDRNNIWTKFSGFGDLNMNIENIFSQISKKDKLDTAGINSIDGETNLFATSTTNESFSSDY